MTSFTDVVDKGTGGLALPSMHAAAHEEDALSTARTTGADDQRPVARAAVSRP